MVDQPTSDCVVRGRILDATGAPCAGVEVVAFDCNLRNEARLGQTTTDALGHYTIPYSANQFRLPWKNLADLVVRALDETGASLGQSALLCNAPTDTTIDVTIQRPEIRLSEYDQLMAALTPRLNGLALAELNAEDIAFLAKTTGQDAERISTMQQSVRCAQALVENGHEPLSESILYAWFRKGILKTTPDLHAQRTDTLREALKAAVAEHMIAPPSPPEEARMHALSAAGAAERLTLREGAVAKDGDWIHAVLTVVQHQRVNAQLRSSGGTGTPTVADLFGDSQTPLVDTNASGKTAATARLSQDKQRILAEQLAGEIGLGTKLWDNLTVHGFEPRDIGLVKQAYDLAALTKNHLPLVRTLQAMDEPTPAQPSGSLQYLARLNEADWHDIITRTGVPDSIQGGGIDERRSRYAAMLERDVEKAFPTTTLAARIKQGRFAVPEAVKPDVMAFFDANPDFTFGREYVGGYLRHDGIARLEGVRDVTQLKTQLSKMERVLKLTDGYRQHSAVLELGFDSAQKMARIGQRDVLARLAAHPAIGEDAAKVIYARAEHTAAMATALMMRYREGGINLPVLPSTRLDVSTLDGASREALKSIPDLRTLFGSLDTCACKSCLSVYSPAAYLVDLLQYLKDRKKDDRFPGPLDVLLNRRPDLAEIELSCENSNTLLPYVDLVMEILENAAGRAFPHPIDVPGAAIDAVTSDLDQKIVNLKLREGLTTLAPALSDKASVEVTSNGSSWIIRDGARLLGVARDVLTFKRVGDVPGRIFRGDAKADVEQLKQNQLPESVRNSIGSIFVSFKWIPVVGARYFQPNQITVANRQIGKLWAVTYRFELTIGYELDEIWITAEGVTPIDFREWQEGFQIIGELKNNRIPVEIQQGYFGGASDIRLRITSGPDETQGAWVLWIERFAEVEYFPLALTWHAPQTSGSPEELKSQPEHLNRTAYDALKKAVYPWNLPFDLWNEEARTYLAHLGVPRHELMRIFYTGPYWDRPIHSTIHGAGYTPALPEQLGISPAELDIISGDRTGVQPKSEENPDPDSGPWNFWGFAAKELSDSKTIPDPADSTKRITSGDWISVLTGRIDVFLQQSGLRYDELRELLDMRYVNMTLTGERILDIELGTITLGDAKTVVTCDLSKAKLTPRNSSFDIEGVLTRMHRFVRLWRKLGRSMMDVDRGARPFMGERYDYLNLKTVISMFGTIPEVLSQRFHIPTYQYAPYWISTVQYIDYRAAGEPRLKSFYDELFLNKGVMDPPDPAFLLTDDREEVQDKTKKLSDHLGTLAAAFGLGIEDTKTLVDHATDDQLTRRNLSEAYFSALGAKALAVSIKQLIALLSLRGNSLYGDFYYPPPPSPAVPDHSDEQPHELGLKFKSTAAGYITGIGFWKAESETGNHIGHIWSETGQELARVEFRNETRWGKQQQLLVNPYRIEADTVYVVSVNVNTHYGYTEKELNKSLQVGTLVIVSDGTNGVKGPPGSFPATPGTGDNYFCDVVFRSLRLPAFGSLATVDVLQAHALTTAEALYLCAHDVPAGGGLAPAEAEINQVIDDIRKALRTIALENRPKPGSEDLTRALGKGAVLQKLGAALGFDITTLDRLLGDWMLSARMDSERTKAIEDFLDPALVETGPEISATPVRFQYTYRTYIRLHKIALLAAKFSLTLEEFGWLFAPDTKSKGWLDLNDLPAATDESPVFLTSLLRLMALIDLRDRLPGGAKVLSDIFAHADIKELGDQALLLRVSGLTGWSLEDLTSLIGPNGYNLTGDSLKAALKHEILLTRLCDSFAAIKRLGATAEQCLRWAKPEIDERAAREIKQLARSRHTPASWAEVAKPLRDVLREKQRQALVSHLVASQQLRDSNDLYSRYLIDVEMSPCAMTSRIKQACASVQLFVQRCLLNLEPDVLPSDIDTQIWSWMKNYRVWEANRKVFLYPENWIEPELRDDKSEFFRQLEGELLKSNVTSDVAQQAFKVYAERLLGISRLTIVSMFDEGVIDGLRTVHVIGRDVSAPYRYHYRTWKIPAQSHDGYWTPWEEVKLSLDSEHLLVFKFANVVYLAWPTIKKENDRPSGRVTVTMNIASRTSQGWSASKKSKGSLSRRVLPNRDDTTNFAFSPIFESKNGGDFVRIAMYQPQSNTKFIDERKLGFYILSLSDKYPPTSSGKFKIDIKVLARYQDIFDTQYTWSVLDVPVTVQADITFNILGSGLVKVSLVLTPPIFRALTVYDFVPQLPPDVSGVYIQSLTFSVDTRSQTKYRPSVQQVTFDVAKAKDGLIAGDFVVDLQESHGNYDLDPEASNEWDETGNFVYLESGAFSASEELFNPKIPRRALYGFTSCYNSYFREVADAYKPPKDDTLRDDSDDPVILYRTPGRFIFAQAVTRDQGANNIPGPFRIAAYSDELVDLLFLSEDGSSVVKALPANTDLLGDIHKEIMAGMNGALVRLQDKPPRNSVAINTARVEANGSTVDMGIRFELSIPWSVYNWEIFFHIPLLVATSLSRNQRFEEAQRWFHFVFDPTSEEGGKDSARFWRFKPFQSEGQGKSIEDELLALAAGSTSLQDQIWQWRHHPFQPHQIARTRHRAYQISTVLKYLDNLIAWGDQLFRRDTIESINEATQLYILASEILGRRPRRVTSKRESSVSTYQGLPNPDAFSNALVQVESLIPPVGDAGTAEGSSNPPNVYTLYFCIPPNEELVEYWDTVEDRLFKIRHCRNIEGVDRQLPLYEPPIDPAVLVRAVAAGVDPSSALADLQSPLPHYRFNVMAQKAQEVANDVKAFGAALLSALEKQDAETLSLLRANQEISLLKMVTMVRESQRNEAMANVAALRKTRELISQRYLQYQRLLGKSSVEVPAEDTAVTLETTPGKAIISRDVGDGDLAGLALTRSEVDHLVWMKVANTYSILSGSFHTAAGIAHAFPNITINNGVIMTEHGGDRIGSALGAFGSFFGMLSSNASFQGNRAATIGSHQRRYDEWAFQANLAAKELEQVDKQIAAAELRVEIAEHELNNHQQQIDNAQEVDAFMRDKFTNAQLYRWMSGQIAGMYFRAYQLAYDLAKRTEKAYRHELGLEDKDSNFIQFGYWDNLKKGLLAGEKLSHDIRRMEVAYLDKNKRELELTKHVSLRQLNPTALLEFKTTGSCQVTIPEWLYDLDCPGHYMRRIKNVALSIPSVVGPYTSINCTLSLLKSTLRKTPLLKEDKYARGLDDERFADYLGAVQSIVTSSGQNDSGLFETNLRDERFLPFEGAGAESTWKLDLPNPKDYPAFNYATITDVILHVRYTARQGVQPDKVREALDFVFQTVPQSDLKLLFSLRYDFPNEWAAFINGTGDFTATIRRDYFPYFITHRQGKAITIKEIQLYDGKDVTKYHAVGDPGKATTELGDLTKLAFTLTAPQDVKDPKVLTRTADAQVFLIIRYSLSS